MPVSYESSVADVMATINASDLPTTTQNVMQAALASLGVAPIVAAIAENLSANNAAELLGDSNTILMSGPTSAVVTFDAHSPVQVMTVGSGGNSVVRFETAKDITVALQGGKDDFVSTGAGNDFISIQGGSATVDTGIGNDRVEIAGGEATINSLDGELEVFIGDGAVGAATVTAGSGFDRVNLVGNASQHTFTFDPVTHRFHMASDFEVDMQGVNVVTFQQNTGSGAIDSATVLASTEADSLTAKLYQVALHRNDGGLDAIQSEYGQLGGLKFWQEAAPEQNDVQQTVYSFLNCAEFHDQYDQMSDEAYVTQLFANLGLAADAQVNGKTVADYVTAITNTADAMIGRYDVAWAIAASQDTVNILGANGDKYVIDSPDLTFDDPIA